jgi:cell division protein FtsQ
MKYELETLPWVRQAQIKRANTHRLDIALDTQKALAYWQNHGVINERLEVFEHIDLSRQLVHLDAPKAKLGDAAQQLRLISQDNNTGLMPQNLQWQPTGVWRLHFKNGLWVIMDGMHYVNELSRLLLSYDRLMAGKDPANYYIDARYPHGLALGLQHSATAKTS